MAQQREGAIDRGRGQPTVDGGLAPTDLPHGSQPLGFVIADPAVSDLGQRGRRAKLDLEQLPSRYG